MIRLGSVRYFCSLLLATSCKHWCFKAPTSCPSLGRLLWKARTSNPWWCLDSALAADAACGWQPKLERLPLPGFKSHLRASGGSQTKKKQLIVQILNDLLDNMYHYASIFNDNNTYPAFIPEYVLTALLQVWPHSIQRARPTRTRRGK